MNRLTAILLVVVLCWLLLIGVVAAVLFVIEWLGR